MMTVARALVRAGITDRRSAKSFIKSHFITVDAVRVFDKDYRFDPSIQVLCADGRTIEVKEDIYLVMNKPSGFTCTNAEGGWNDNVFSLLPFEYTHSSGTGPLHTVGRLDKDTEGLLLLTTDGELSHKLTDPCNDCTKIYSVRLARPFSDAEKLLCKKRFESGIELSEDKKGSAFKAKPASVVWKGDACCEITVSEGKFHQVKRMFAECDNEVTYLKRIAIKNLYLDDGLKSGSYRKLTSEEIINLE